ncbi:hypothetical protein KSP39_PZI001483 [Platanthera zijinensis]|uniref:K Homology domain-containing protein n=1 Tax=Platanthera zijinensis TaxID=2320716 RepID=A0AAP0C595_9ASPA
MDRSRSKRSYHHDHDSDSQTPPPRTKPRYDGGSHRRTNHQHRNSDRRPSPPPPPPPPPIHPPSPDSVTTFFRILCSDAKIGSVIGKSGSIIRSIRRDTGAWINVHELLPGDEERIIETADGRRRDSNGRPPHYSPAQEALLLIHEKVLDADLEDAAQEEEHDAESGMWGGVERSRERGRVTTRLVVPMMHVGCLLGKGGKIIEHMRNETKTHIRVLPREDLRTPRCISMSEEVVQVFGESSCVKKAVKIISFRLKESQHREHGPFHGRIHSSDDYFLPDADLIGSIQHQSAFERADLGPRTAVGPTRVRNNAYGSENNYLFDSDSDAMIDRPQTFTVEDIAFRILCPRDKVETVIGPLSGIGEMLQTDVGVHVRVTDPVEGSDEQVIVITSDEGPDDELFPAQEALLHVQTHIVDLGPDKDNIITTRLLVQASEIECLEGKDGSLSDFKKLTCANVQVLPKEDLPLCALETDEIIQIVGEIRAARKALVHVTAKLRGYFYRDLSVPPDVMPRPFSATSHVGKIVGLESNSIRSLPCEGYQGSDPPVASFEIVRASSTNWPSKDSAISASGSLELEQNFINDSVRHSGLKRFAAPLITKSTFEVVIPEDAVSSLITKSGSKLAQISEISGATMILLEDRPDSSDKVVQISGTPEQAERAQSLLQGFILSTL